MDLYNIFTKIPYIIMLGIGLTLVLQIYIGSLSNFSASLDDNVEPANDVLTVTEAIHALGEDEDLYRSEVPLDKLVTNDECNAGNIPGVPERDITYQIGVQGDSGLDDELDCNEGVPSGEHYGYVSRILIIDDDVNNPVPGVLMVVDNE